jgi:cobalt-zinc-cadmium efflux system outer membrane protein
MKALLFLTVLSVSAAAAGADRLTLNAKYLSELAEEARTNHPALRAADARLRAATKSERAVSLWEDPEVSVGAMAGSANKRAEEGDLLYGIDQKLPLTGKPQAERARARAELSVEEAALDWRFQTLRKEIALAAFKAALAQELERIAVEDAAWAQTMAATTSERYKAGRATQVELLRMETEHAARAEQVRVAARDRDAQRLALNRLLNRPLETTWPNLALPDLARPLASSERLAQIGEKFEPRLRMLRRETLLAQASVESARRARRPDFSVGVEGRQFHGNGEFKEGIVLFKMSLPLFNGKKYDAIRDREKDRADAANWEAEAYAAQAREEIAQLVIRIANARRQALLQRDEIIPRAAQTQTVAESSWLNGRAQFHDVLDARRVLLEARMNVARAVAEQYIALSELALCCGLADLESVELYQNATEEK